MKKSLLGILAVGLFTTSANAGILSLRFAGGGNEVTMGPSDTATIEVVFQMTAIQTGKARLTGADMRFEVGGLAAGVGGDYVFDDSHKFTVESVATPIAGWSTAASILGEFNQNGFFLSAGDPAGAAGPVGNATLQPELVIASFTIHKVGPVVPADTYVVFRVGSALPALTQGGTGWTNAWQDNADAIREYDIGQGNPGDADPRWDPYHGYETLQPLIIHQVPEPGSIALLVLGGLAAMRRRK
jgi:hypothetical protein